MPLVHPVSQLADNCLVLISLLVWSVSEKKREIENGNESERISCKREEVWSVSAGVGVWQKKQGYHIVV